MKTEPTKPVVLVCGRNGSSNLCMARSFGIAGYPVEVLRITPKKANPLNLMQYLNPEIHSKYVRAYHNVLCNNENRIIADKLLSLAQKGEKMLLVPSCDMAASAIDEFMEQLREFYWMPNVADTAGELNRLMRKDVQVELARNAGLPVVNSCVIKTQNGGFSIPDSVRYPCFIKPNVSRYGKKTVICRCDSKEQLQQNLTRFSQTEDIEMLVEDYLEINREYSILGVSAGPDVAAPGFFAAEEGGHGSRRGIAMVGSMCDTQPQQELIDQVARFVGTLNFVGLFDVDLIETSDGKLYFVELNLRYGASGYAVTQSGANLPAMYADYQINGTPIDTTCAVKTAGKRFVSEKVVLVEYAHGFLSLAQVSKIMKNTQIRFIQDQEDPEPYRHFRKFYLFGMATHTLFRLKRAIKK